MPAAAPARNLVELDIDQEPNDGSYPIKPKEANRSTATTNRDTCGPRHLHLVPASTAAHNSAAISVAAANVAVTNSLAPNSPAPNSSAANSPIGTVQSDNTEADPATSRHDEGATFGGRHRRRPLLLRLMRDDSGLSTAEYAVATVAACAFAAVLFRILTGNEVIGLVTGLIRRGLDVIQ